MVEKFVAPSELHLKKELIALRKARMLRDPETCSSLRSPFSSKSFATYNLCYENEVRDVPTRENISSLLPEIPLRIEKSRKKVYLYNWKNHSSKSSESGIKLDEDGKQPSVESCLEDNLSNSEKEATLGGRFFLPAPNIYNGRDGDIGTTTPRRSGIRLKKTAISSRRVKKHASNLMQLDLPSNSTRVLSSVEQSDDTRRCNSEDEHRRQFDQLFKDSHYPPCTSSLFSGSGCANWPRPSTIFRNTRRDGSSHSCTPASTSSYYRHVGQKPSTAGSWGGTGSFEEDEFDQRDFPIHQRCGLPCYRSKRTKDRSCRDCYSLSLCDTKEKVGDGVFCGSQKIYNAKRSVGLSRPKPVRKSSQFLPLLTNDYVTNTSSDEPLTNLRELDLEALSRLDERRWSSSKSQDAIKVAGSSTVSLDITDDKSLCVKYKPRSFDEIIGQNIVVQSLMNATLRNKIAPAYLFHGPCGTGKTSAARIFSAAINCLAIEGSKPCCLCKACTTSYGESGYFVTEVCATNKKGVDSIRHLLKSMTLTSRLLQYRILIINECHLLTSKMWSALLKYLEDPISLVVLILITNDHENLPHSIISRCKKYQFSKIKDADIVRRLRKLSAVENLEIEIDALNLIASNSDGSLRDAETMLYQLSLLGKRITTSLVNDLVGFVSDEKLLDLLELAMSSKAEETVKMAGELMDSGVDPTVLVSQLAGVMMDIVAGTHQLAHSQYENAILGGRSFTKEELKRLQQALKTLSDAEKQLKQSTEHSSLLTSALLQLALGQNMESIQLNIVEKHGDQVMKDSTKKRSSDYNMTHKFLASREPSSVLVPSHRSTKSNPSVHRTPIRVLRSHEFVSSAILQNIQNKRSSSEKPQIDHNATGSPTKLSAIWINCIEKCYSKTLKQFLSSHGKLISVTENEGILIAFIAFEDCSLKSRAERYVSSITNSLEMVLKKNVEVRMGIVPNDWKSLERPLDLLTSQPMQKPGILKNQRMIEPDDSKGLPDKFCDNLDFPQESRDDSVGAGNSIVEKNCTSLPLNDGFELESCSDCSEGNIGSTGTKEKGTGISFVKALLPFSIEQKLENAWLQDAEKGLSGLPNLSRADANLAIHPNCGSSHLSCDPSMTTDKPLRNREDKPLRNREDKPKHEIKALDTNDDLDQDKAQDGKDRNHHATSPSKLHCNSFGTNFDQQNSEYESGPGCSGLFCWKTNNSHRQHMKEGYHPRYQKTSRMLLFKKKMKSKKGRSRSRR